MIEEVLVTYFASLNGKYCNGEMSQWGERRSIILSDQFG